jgi:hypothetical protein
MSDYDFQQAQIMDEARRWGRYPRDFSADAWAGIRETIKNTGELYGTPFKGSAVGGGKGYADQFSDALAAGAKHLGMDQDKLEHELRSGNTNLLSYVLATTPAAAAAYSTWRGNLGGNAPTSSSGERRPEPPAL